VSLHHYQRLVSHIDPKSLTPAEFAVALVIANGINDKDPSKMRFSNSYLAEITPFNENTCQRATKGLVEKGVFSRSRDKARQATLYALLVECPAECKKRTHYTAREHGERRYLSTFESAKELTNNTPRPLTDGLLIETIETIENNKKLVEVHSEPLSVVVDFSMAEFQQILDYSTEDSLDHRAVMSDPERAYQIALIRIANTRAKQPVTSPKGLIKRIYETNPKSLLGGLPGTQPRNPDFVAVARRSQPLEPFTDRRGYLELVTELCADLGVNYELEFGNSVRDRELRSKHLEGRLNLHAVRDAYNAVREPSDYLETAPNAY
jgi:hypothetical protein